MLIGLLLGIGVALIGTWGQHIIPNLSAFSVSPNPLLRALSGARLAVFSFYISLGGQPVFKEKLLEE